METYQTEQEKFWAGEFGDAYVDRNRDQNIVASNISLFSKIFSRTRGVSSVLELGANIGLNLQAIKVLKPGILMTAIEINKKAADRLKQDFVNKELTVYEQSILTYEPRLKFDFVLIRGVLIHMNPIVLQDVYEILYKSTAKYICIAEYYNPTPTEVTYRGHAERLFKRDFAGEMLDKYPSLALQDYGFVYHRDNNFLQDDITWFLLEKRENIR